MLDSFAKFDPRIADITREFFDRRWIDAAVVPGKLGGGGYYPTVPSLHPYIVMNYEGHLDDVMTLAHELGHGVHGYLSRKQSILQAQTPLTTAETASVFGEILVFQEMLVRETDPAVRMAMLTSEIEKNIATAARQVSIKFLDGLTVLNALPTSFKAAACKTPRRCARAALLYHRP